MATGSELGKRSAFALASILAWLALFIAFLATMATMTVNNMSHVGNTASTIVQRLSKDPATIDSLLDEFKKNADPKTVAEIDKNRTTIESTISSLGGDKAFQDSLADTLNKISHAILSGSKSVTVDFGPLATAVAIKVNEAAKSTVISKKELAKLKPQVLDLSKQSSDISGARNKVKEVTLAWLLWLVLLGVLYLLKRWKFVRTAGWQLFSVGILFLALRFVAPVVLDKALANSDSPVYLRDLLQEVLKMLFGPMMTLSIIAALVGFALLVGDQLLRNRSQQNPHQISPSVVA